MVTSLKVLAKGGQKSCPSLICLSAVGKYEALGRLLYCETLSQVGLPGSQALILAPARSCQELLVGITGTQPAGVSSGREGESEIDS